MMEAVAAATLRADCAISVKQKILVAPKCYLTCSLAANHLSPSFPPSIHPFIHPSTSGSQEIRPGLPYISVYNISLTSYQYPVVCTQTLLHRNFTPSTQSCLAQSFQAGQAAGDQGSFTADHLHLRALMSRPSLPSQLSLSVSLPYSFSTIYQLHSPDMLIYLYVY